MCAVRRRARQPGERGAPQVLGCGPCLDPEWRGAWHCHRAACELLYVTRGRGESWAEDRAWTAEAGDLIVHNAGAWHRERRLSEDFAAVVVSYRAAADRPGIPLPADLPVVVRSADLGEDLRALFRLLAGEAQRADSASGAMCFALAQAAYCGLERLFHRRASVRRESGVCLGVTAYLEENYAKPVTLEDVAKSLSLSKFYVAHVVKELHGQSPMKLLLDIRMREARRRLVSTDRSIDGIAQDVGYSDGAAFSRAFKAHEGVAPGTYRKTRRA